MVAGGATGHGGDPEGEEVIGGFQRGPFQLAYQQVPAAGGTDTHDGLPKRRKRFNDSAQTQVIRESQLKPKQRKEKKSATVVLAPAPSFDHALEDEELLALQLDEDERLNRILELAASVLKTLH